MRDVVSGAAIAMFFGTISPNTVCTKTTRISAVTKPIPVRSRSGISTIELTSDSMMWATPPRR